ncbi:cystatin-B-like [Gymnodraco acuticeps]|uniref:Cystatin-B n=1 Tax=Gymnodraco acuticeps TaxID=8218 RepID=A0A6P8SZ76_GYMAC|nr:cystatin-B-like [Gymnodraco acuticeps]
MANQVMGGWTGTQEATEDTQKICEAVKDQVEKQTKQKYVVYKAVKYRAQLVAGQNLTIKVFAGEEDYIHLSVFQQLPCNGGKVELHNVEVGKTKDDPLGTF